MTGLRKAAVLGVALALVLTIAGSELAIGGPPSGAPTHEAQAVIVVLTPGADAASVAHEYGRRGAEVSRVYRAIGGFAARMTPAGRSAAATDPRVELVAADGEVTAADVQAPTPSWGLDRIDERERDATSSYRYDHDGHGVDVYVLDTGVRASHDDFGGRVRPGLDAVANATTDDCNGHGTHVAGTAGGRQYGVAKRVGIVAVRVLGCNGKGTWSAVVAGLDWVTADHQSGAQAVANLSLSGGVNAAADAAVGRMIADGVVAVVSAGNDAADACSFSPANVPAALTVGATTSVDARATYSNVGACVDLFAPGSGIVSAGISSDAASATKSGTSMAAPHVAGVAALELARDATLSPAGVAAAIVTNATAAVLAGVPTDTANLLVHSLHEPVAPPPDLDPEPDPDPATVPDPPSDVAASAGRRVATVSWSAGADGGSAITSFTVRVYERSSTAATRALVVGAPALSLVVDGLKPGRTYRFTVAATNAVGTSAESSPSASISVSASSMQ